MAFKRKPIRLPLENYRGRRIYFVTVCCQRRIPLFSTGKLGRWLIGHLRDTAAEHAFAVHAYCVMPDHLHLLVEGLKDVCDLRRFVNSFKQRTAYDFRRRDGTQLWQAKYYDHILRKAEAMDAVAWYIWLNPVRKGLCSEPRQYPLSGSFTLKLKDRSPGTRIWSPPWKVPIGS